MRQYLGGYPGGILAHLEVSVCPEVHLDPANGFAEIANTEDALQECCHELQDALKKAERFTEECLEE